MKHRIANGTQARELLIGLRSGVTIPKLFKCNTSIGIVEPVRENTQLCELTVQAMELLADERYRDGIYTVRITKHGKKIELNCEMAFVKHLATGNDDEVEDRDTIRNIIKFMRRSIYGYLDTETPSDIVMSRNMVDNEIDEDADDEADACHQPVLQFIISKSKEDDKRLRVTITTLINRIADRNVSADIKTVCISSCLEAPELSAFGTYEVSVRYRAEDETGKVGVKLTIIHLQDDNRFIKYHGSIIIGAVEEKPSLGEILDYLQDKLSGAIIAETNLGDCDDQLDLIRAINTLTR